MFNQIFLSPLVKQSVVISNKHGIYELPHDFLNDLGLYDLGTLKTIYLSLFIYLLYFLPSCNSKKITNK